MLVKPGRWQVEMPESMETFLLQLSGQFESRTLTVKPDSGWLFRVWLLVQYEYGKHGMPLILEGRPVEGQVDRMELQLRQPRWLPFLIWGIVVVSAGLILWDSRPDEYPGLMVVFAVISLVIGLFHFVLWWQTRRSARQEIDKLLPPLPVENI